MDKNKSQFKNIENAYPLTKLQSGMIFHSQYSNNSTVYHDIFTYHLGGPYNYNILKRALEKLISVQPVLRTSFNLVNFSEPLQLVHSESIVPIEEIDIRDLAESNQKKELENWLEKEKTMQFDWEKYPLFKVVIHRLKDELYDVSISFHHSILDGWSVAIMMKELFQIYLGMISNEDYQFKLTSNVSFRDFVALEHSAVKSDECKNYWKNKLGDSTFTSIPRWPFKKVEHKYFTEKVEIGKELTEALINLSKNNKVPLKDVLLAVHLRVIGLVTGEKDIVTGVVSNGRPEKIGSEEILGLFLNTVPFRANLNNGTWKELINQTFDLEQEMFPYRRYPLEEILKTVNRDSIYETVFNFMNFHVLDGNGEDINEIKVLGIDTFEETNFPFVALFSLDPFSNKLTISIVYDGKEFSGEQIKHIGRYYFNAIKQIATKPDETYLNNTQEILGEEYTELVDEWSKENVKNDELVEEKFLFEKLEYFAKENPNNSALIYEDKILSYCELNQRVNKLARYLSESELGDKKVVGVYMDKSFDLLISILAIWKIGGVYIPLDLRNPSERIKFILEDTNLELVLSESNLISNIDIGNRKKICLDESWVEIDKLSGENINVTYDIDSLAYIIYTSGSTGKPKGVLLSHRGIFNNLIEEARNVYDIKVEDRIIALASVGFDISMLEIVMAIGNGATLCLAKTMDTMPDERLLNTLEKMKVTVMTMTPTALSCLPYRELPHLRLISVGGEVCTKELATKWSKNRTFLNIYGPTEITVWSHSFRYENNEYFDKVSIGKPLRNVEQYVFDENQQVVPIGALGELYIGGVGVAKGYLNRESLTKEKFVYHVFETGKGVNLYRTGDVVRYLPDGNLDFMRRIDNQVKVSGFRIELEEIENSILNDKNIKNAVVVVREESENDKRLVAYLVPEEGHDISIGNLRQELGKKLPSYMVPSSFVVLEMLPLTKNGKIDKSKLPESGNNIANSEKEYVAPRSEMEVKLAKIWADVLKVDKVGINDNFFELGGNSILALQVMNRIHNEFDNNIELRLLFENPTVEQLLLIILNEEVAATNLDEIEQLLKEIE